MYSIHKERKTDLNMVSSSLTSSSFFKKPNEKRISLESLPEDLLVEVSSRTAAFSLSAVRNLRLVSKTFRKICDEKYLLSRLSLQELPLVHWYDQPERFSNFFKRCRRNGNPEALYRKGLISYFDLENRKHKGLILLSAQNRKHKGLQLLSEAARKGNKEASYVYGLIIICLGGRGIPEGRVLLGGETKQEGFKILSSLIKPLMSKTLKELEELRRKIREHVWWGRGIPVMKELKRAYVREKCECDGQTKKFLAYNCAWHEYGEENDMTTSSACEFCLWDHEVERFFNNIE